MPRLTLALSHYDRLLPLYDGTVGFEGFEVEVLHVGQSLAGRHGNHRHERMLQAGEFDVCEMSLSSYLMAHDRGHPLTAIPIFPRRLFSQSGIWINADAGIRAPQDLIGRKVGLGMVQTTLSVLAIGDMQAEYGVPWRAIEWHVDRDESVPYDPPKEAKIHRLPEGSDIGEMLERGELAAVFRPHPPKPVLRGSKKIVRLFPDPKKEEEQYFRRNGFYPIMHLIAFRNDVLERHPTAAMAFMKAFERADEISEEYYDDPNWSRLAWGRHYFEAERDLMGAVAWPSGIARNRKNLERFVGYSLDLGLIRQPPAIEDLFDRSVRLT